LSRQFDLIFDCDRYFDLNPCRFISNLTKADVFNDQVGFFRFNRKVIGGVGAIRDIRTYLNSRLRISLVAGNLNDEAIVSRERVQAFRQWADA